MVRKRLFVTLVMMIGFMTLENLQGQQKPVFSQYLFNALAINPAFAGSQDQFSSTIIYRNQWVNFPGAPTIQTLSANTAFSKKKIGVGFVLTRDQVGVHSDFGLYFAYAYRIRMVNGVLSLGLQAGFNSLKSDFTELNLNNINDPNFAGVFGRLNPNFGTGVFYVNKRLYLGFSIPALLNNKIFKGDISLSEAQERRNYYITGGRLFDLNDLFQIKPSVVIRVQEQAPLGADFSLQLIYNRMISTGVSYRSGDSMIWNFELQMNDNLRIGYAYEWAISAIAPFTRGSHEVMLNYRINIPGLNKGGLECPTYF